MTNDKPEQASGPAQARDEPTAQGKADKAYEEIQKTSAFNAKMEVLQTSILGTRSTESSRSLPEQAAARIEESMSDWKKKIEQAPLSIRPDIPINFSVRPKPEVAQWIVKQAAKMRVSNNQLVCAIVEAAKEQDDER